MSRLRRLYDASYLDAHVIDRASENIYSVGRLGKAWLETHDGHVGALPRRPWHHHLGIVQFWAAIATATHVISGVRLTSFQPEWVLRGREDGVDDAVVPDALVELIGHADRSLGPVRLAVEVDRGTEGLVVLRRKIRLYSSLTKRNGMLSQGKFSLVILLQDDGVRREAAIRELLAAEWSSGSHVWTESTDLSAELHELFGLSLPVTGSRHGNGREDGANADLTGLPTVTVGGPSADD
jgi:hypothetical protein